MRHLLFVVDQTGDQRTIRVTLFKGDDDLLVDARNPHAPRTLAGHDLGTANPARAVLVEFPFAIPVKLDFDAPVFVRVDLLPLGPHHDRRLNALHRRAWG